MKEKKESISEKLPLNALCLSLCAKPGAGLFRKQAELFQLLSVFLSNNVLDGTTKTTDDILPNLHDYIQATTKLGYNENAFTDLHNTFFQNICLRTPSKKDSLPLVLDTSTIDLSNMRRYISGKQGLPHGISNELEKQRDSMESVLRRLFWLLQYYTVYYFRRDQNYKNIIPKTIVSVQTNYPEYYSFSSEYANLLYLKLCDHCLSFSTTLSHIVSANQIDFITLSRIILEVLISHYDHHTKRFIMPDAVPFLKSVTPNDDQLLIYQTRIDCFSRNSFDRFNVLLKWADRNYYAAAELGDIYLHGIDQHITTGCQKEIKRNYQKASEYYMRSIALSSPPYPYACWSYADMLRDKYKDGVDAGDISILETGLDYLIKAGGYPPALNLRANYEMMIADYRKKNDSSFSDDDLKQMYKSALLHAKHAAESGWFYAYSRIAMFLKDHEDDTDTLSFLSTIPELRDYLDRETLLKRIAEHNSLWAINELAELYISKESPDKAEPLLKRACDLGYNRAFYTMAMHICRDPETRTDFLRKASEMSYPHASYELAVIYRKRHDNVKALEYINLANQQMNCWIRKKFDMADKIVRLKEAIENDF